MEAFGPTFDGVSFGGIWIDEYGVVDDRYRKRSNVVGEGVEGAAACEVETGVVPVAGEDAVFDGAAVEGEAHVGASVVDGGEGFVFNENGDGVSGASDDGAAAFSEFVG